MNNNIIYIGGTEGNDGSFRISGNNIQKRVGSAWVNSPPIDREWFDEAKRSSLDLIIDDEIKKLKRNSK